MSSLSSDQFTTRPIAIMIRPHGGATTQVSELLWEPSLNCPKQKVEDQRFDFEGRGQSQKRKHLPACLNCSLCMNGSKCLNCLSELRRKLSPQSNNLTNAVILANHKISQFPVEVSELLWLHLFSELLDYRPSSHN